MRWVRWIAVLTTVLTVAACSSGGSSPQPAAVDTQAAQSTAGPYGNSVATPDLVGSQEHAGLAVLGERDLLLGNVSAKHSSEPDGTVLSQKPAAGVTVATGSAINLVVSAGP